MRREKEGKAREGRGEEVGSNFIKDKSSWCWSVGQSPVFMSLDSFSYPKDHLQIWVPKLSVFVASFKHLRKWRSVNNNTLICLLPEHPHRKLDFLCNSLLKNDFSVNKHEVSFLISSNEMFTFKISQEILEQQEMHSTIWRWPFLYFDY